MRFSTAKFDSLTFVVGLALFASACAPDFIEPWDVRKPRHFIAKVSIDGDSEGRTRPRPGESVSLAFFMMSPERPQATYSGALSICAGAALPNGSLVCVEELPLPAPIGEASYQGDDKLAVSSIPVPQELDSLPPELDRVTLIGSFCANGSVQRVPDTSAKNDPVSELYTCTDNDDAAYKTQLPFTMSLWLDRGLPGQQNHNPSFTCDVDEPTGACHDGVQLSGVQLVPGAFVLQLPKAAGAREAEVVAWNAWAPEQPVPWDDCASVDALPKVRAGDKEYTIHARFDASDRETFERTVRVNGTDTREIRREDLVVAHALTNKGGELQRFESVVFNDDEESEAEIAVKYTPPGKHLKREEDRIPETGRLVRFFFAVRDLRGGADFTTRELCILPAEPG